MQKNTRNEVRQEDTLQYIRRILNAKEKKEDNYDVPAPFIIRKYTVENRHILK